MYQLTNSSIIHRLADNTWIPADPASTDYAQYLAWLAEGNEPLPADPIVPAIPQVVSKFQAKAALHQAGLLAQVEALMASESTPMLARLAWADAQEFRRTSPTVAAMAAALGLDDAALDALFTQAASIEA